MIEQGFELKKKLGVNLQSCKFYPSFKVVIITDLGQRQKSA